MNIEKKLQDLRACKEAKKWVAEQDGNAYSMWRCCHQGDWLLWLAARVGIDRKTLVNAACQAARTALVYVPDGETRPLHCIEVTEAWCRSSASLDDVDAAALAARAAARAADAAAWAAAHTRAAALDSRAAWAAAWAARAAAAAAEVVDAAEAVDVIDAAARAADAAADAARAARAAADAVDAAADADDARAARAARAAATSASLAESARIVRRYIPWRMVRDALGSN